MNLNKSSCQYFAKEGSTLTHVTSSYLNKQGNSRIQNYVSKLENICKEHSRKIKSNRPAIEELQYQRRFFKRICEKQKEKIQGINLKMIREEYQTQIQNLRDTRNHLHEMINQIHDEAQQKKQHFIESQLSLQQNRQFLQQSLEEIYEQNRKYRQLLQGKLQIVENDKYQIEANDQLIKDKQKIEDKYKFVCNQIKIKEERRNEAVN